MTNRINYTGDNRKTDFMKTMAAITAVVFMLLFIIILTGCSKNEAEVIVNEELDSMRTLDLDQASVEELEGLLSKEGREYFYEFKRKAADYEYKILGSEENDDGTTAVSVQVKTYSFGRIYLETWADYLEDNKGDRFDQSDFYELLVKNLSEADTKDYAATVIVTCSDPEKDGNWKTDAGSNKALRDALFGGMLTEIASLAEM